MIGADGLTIRRSSGSGCAVVLCHGNSMASWLFEKQLESSLGETHQLVAPDLPGHGDSPWDPERYTLAAMAEAILGVVKGLELERPVLVGHSLGGHLMTRVAASLGSIRGLFVLGTPLLASAASVPEAFLPHPALGLFFQAELSDDDVAALTGLLVPDGGADAKRVERALRQSDPQVRACIGASLQGDLPDEVALAAGLDAPVAVVHSANDPLVNLAYLEQLSLPNLWRRAVQIIDGGGHVPQLTSPQAFNALLGEFLKEVS